ncbi:ABC-three component system protein [Nocardia jinanensis]|uniref:ABC-three component system protein n=1 Tax=Nocardia jinanensis TaxID=382504 RepID=UPI00073883FF|nr:ABC-three component system protein [Nocardia jinanensis]
MSLDYMQRLAVRLLLKDRLSELHSAAFEEFFHELMCLRHPGFLDVRTAGSLGDEGSDGLLLHARKLYACYGPQVFDVTKVVEKFESDLTKALTKRSAEFSTFVFVHNDHRGMHPTVSRCLASAQADNPGILFEQFGHKHFRNEVCRLQLHEVEDLLKTQVPVKDAVYGIGLDELQPLLEHLRTQRRRTNDSNVVAAVSGKKLDFNGFSEDTKEDLRRMMVRSLDIDLYYSQRVDVTERDEVAAGFNEEYLRLRREFDDPDDILWQLEQYVLGNASAPHANRRAAMAVLAYFFQSCDIFDNPPPEYLEGCPDVEEEFA